MRGMDSNLRGLHLDVRLHPAVCGNQGPYRNGDECGRLGKPQSSSSQRSLDLGDHNWPKADRKWQLGVFTLRQTITD